MGTTPIFALPYPDPSDLVANYPVLGQQLAEDVEDLIVERKVLQVVSATRSTQANSGTNVFADTGLTATITPTSATNKVLVMVLQAGIAKVTGNTNVQLRLVRTSTTIATIETAAAETGNTTVNYIGASGINFLDTPATTSAVTYKTQFMSTNNTNLAIVQVGSATSSIVLMEVYA